MHNRVAGGSNQGPGLVGSAQSLQQIEDGGHKAGSLDAPGRVCETCGRVPRVATGEGVEINPIGVAK
jgi:hypothetical protein